MLPVNASFKNYLQSKHEHSKSSTKVMNKSELFKEQTRWRLGNKFNYIKEKNKINRFLLIILQWKVKNACLCFVDEN